MRLLPYFLFAAIMASCGNQAQTENLVAPDDQQKIAELEALVYSDTAKSLNMETAMELAELYTRNVRENPRDSLAPETLFKAGELYMNAKMGNKAIARFNNVSVQFPNSEQAPVAMFLKGFVAETILKDDGLAKELYAEFIRAHPTHALADDAQASIDLLGLSDDELLKRITERTK